MFNILSHWVSKNQNHSEMPLHTEMAVIKKTDNNKGWQGYSEIRNLINLPVGYNMVQQFCKTLWQFLRMFNILQEVKTPIFMKPCS